MITYRMETQAPDEPNNRRTLGLIAVVFVAVSVVAAAAVFIITRRNLTVTIVAKNDAKTIVVPIKILSAETKNSFDSTVTTTDFSYSQIFYPTGTKTVDATATGNVTLINKTGAAQTLVKTTRLLTKDGVLFRLTDKVTVPANGEVAAAVYADQPGSAGNIAPAHFTIPGLSADKQTVIYADSADTMAGGVVTSGVLTAKDIASAQTSYQTKVLAAYLATLPQASDGSRVALVYKNYVVANQRAGDEVTKFTISGRNSIAVITYSKDAILAALQNQLRGTIDVANEKIVSASPEPKVVLKSYNPVTGAAELAVTEDVLLTIDPNADKLAPANFFGKTKAEIERYVLGLDHVDRVEAVLSPSWIDSAPKSPDKIKVVVKDM